MFSFSEWYWEQNDASNESSFYQTQKVQVCLSKLIFEEKTTKNL